MMAYLMCRWMNKELRLSQVIDPQTFARNLSNGYIIGEILHRYNMLTDFSVFFNDDCKSSKVNNFLHLKPTLQMLGVSFDETTAKELMQEKQDVALNIIYELYIALEKKKKGNIGGTVVDMISNPASNHLRMKEQDLYSERLHRGFGPSANMNLRASQQINSEDQRLDYTPTETNASEHKKTPPVKDKIKRQMNVTTTVQDAKDLQKQQDQQRHSEKQTQTLQNEIHQFEANTRKLVTAKSILGHSTKSEAESMQHFNSEYIEQIRLRMEMDTDTQKQREKRAAHFLMELSKAQRAEQDAQIEDFLVKRLTRQTKEEELLVAQLLQKRTEKEVLIRNNLIRQQQIQKRREKDFQEALEREAALVRQERLANAAEIQRELDLSKKLVAERKHNRFMKHFDSCKDIMGQIVDLATKAGDYRALTGRILISKRDNSVIRILIPGQQMREWKESLFKGKPLYEANHDENKGLDPVGLSKQDVLNKHDYEEYKNRVGEWAWPEAQKTEIAPTTCSIFDHVIVRLRNIVHPPSVKPFPPFNLKACVLGKFCSGKSNCLYKIAQAYDIFVLSTEKLVEEVINAYRSIEEGSERQDIAKNRSSEDGQDSSKKNTNCQWALLGEAVNKVTEEGKPFPNELLVDIVTEAIKQLPANSGWILDGFPVDITQAHLLEKALGGSVEEAGAVSDSNTSHTCPPKASAPALHLALFLDVPDECVASRAANQTDQNKLTAISSRIAAFENTWPELEEWFGRKQNILVRVNANVDEEETFKAVESILQQPPKGPLESLWKLNNSLAFVDEPVPQDIAASLVLRWDTVCESYVNKVEAVLQDLRLQRTTIELHFFHYREEFKMYLNRTDPKHDLISQWQKDYNRICLNLRKDKGKLQERLDDLLEELWDMSDKRREENEQKMAAVKEDGWLVTCAAVLLQHHSTLLQVELEQFQDALCILKIYYLSMCKQTMANNDLQIQEECIMYNVQLTERIKPPHENQICDYEEALKTICNLISAEAQLFKRETLKDDKSTLQSTDKNSCPTFDQRPNDKQADIDVSDDAIDGSAILNKIYYEYLAALNQAADATKARLALIKSHDFEMVNALHSRADKAFNSLKSLMKEQFVEEMKSIEDVAEAVRHYIEFDPILQNGLDLLASHQYVNDCCGTAPPPSTVFENLNTVKKV